MSIDTQAGPDQQTTAPKRRRSSAMRPRVQLVPRATPPSPRALLISYALSLLSAVLIAVLVNLTVISQFQHLTAQRSLYASLRLSLAAGSAPIGQTDVNGQLVVPGTPIALLQIPAIGVDEVVIEGTTSTQTRRAVGHSRDSPLPGQPGVSVLMGRQAAYGGVFGDLDRLRSGDVITVTTGQGISQYRVIGPRTGTEELPDLGVGQGRLMLISASGLPFMPDGTVRVDATLISKAFPRPAPVFSSGALTPQEKPMAGDDSHAVALSWLLELLVLIAVGAVVAWQRWDRRAAWIVFLPLVLVTSLACADRICDLLPNLV
ncbi:sortase [Nocardioides baekrokdamisoli]|uniref:Sortase n=1 Tax=Nocardioides baekrokdamisoli TaxID=1804624 RepID=A0A3G9IF24_9ACTN|nr:class E sortase [Nocardioides baekrokdamisoli]BBH16976.1 sortase [Nocardioides baekrokdamisoli]